MASVCNDPGGRRRILFTGADGSRKAIRLGKAPKRTADCVCGYVERLLAAALTGSAPDAEVSLWVAALDVTLYWKCVHLGCTVPWIDGQHRFICPCHGSVYEYNGTRIAGPAARALDRMPVTVDDAGNISVNTNPNTIVERSVYTPEDAVPYPA